MRRVVQAWLVTLTSMRTLPSLSWSKDVTRFEGRKELNSASSASCSRRDMMAIQTESMPHSAASDMLSWR